MHAALRPYVTAGIALVGASMIAVTPVTPSLPGLPVEQTATRLLASSGSIANIPVNLAHRDGQHPVLRVVGLTGVCVRPRAARLGRRGAGMDSPGATVANGGVDPGPDGVEGTADDLYARGGTGSWYTESTAATPGDGTTATGRSWRRSVSLSRRSSSRCPSPNNCRFLRRPSSSPEPASIASSSAPTSWVT